MATHPSEPIGELALNPVATGRKRRFATFRTIMALILREMSTRYGRSPGGYIWAVLEPLGGVLVLGLGFSLLMRHPALGNNFFLFFATGFLPFNLYQSVAQTVSRAITFSKPLLRYPAVTWVDALFARFILNSLTGILIAYILMAGILSFAETRTVLDVRPMAIAVGQAMIIGLGVGALNCALMGLFRTWDVIWSVLTRPLFLASGVFFLFDNMSAQFQNIMWYNPLIHVVSYMRMGFYPSYNPSFVSIIYPVGFGLVTLALGLVLIGRYHQDFIND